MSTERAAPDTLVARPPLRSLVDDLHERRVASHVQRLLQGAVGRGGGIRRLLLRSLVGEQVALHEFLATHEDAHGARSARADLVARSGGADHSAGIIATDIEADSKHNRLLQCYSAIGE